MLLLITAHISRGTPPRQDLILLPAWAASLHREPDVMAAEIDPLDNILNEYQAGRAIIEEGLALGEYIMQKYGIPKIEYSFLEGL